MTRTRCALATLLVLLVGHGTDAWAFPPYRSTDADTADPWTVEARLGVFAIERDQDANSYTLPLLRVNFGLPHKWEILSEFEYALTAEEVGEAAVGVKWIPLVGAISVGVEALVLLPLGDGGVGVEAQALATWRRDGLRIHVNAGGFHDARGDGSESGWKASVLTEYAIGPVRPGIEVANKDSSETAIRTQLGVGAIVTFGRFDVRVGGHLGLTDAAPDVTASVWLSGKLPVR